MFQSVHECPGMIPGLRDTVEKIVVFVPTFADRFPRFFGIRCPVEFTLRFLETTVFA